MFDVGIAKATRELGLPKINILNTLNAKQREPLGGIIEQYVCNELLYDYPKLVGFREKKYEIDFVLKIQDQVIPVECKASLKANKNQYRSLDLYHQGYGNQKAVIVSLTPYSVVKRAGYILYHVPVYALDCFEELVLQSKSS